MGDDGVTVVGAVKFATKDDYRKLAEDPFQAGTPALTSPWSKAGEKEGDPGSGSRS